MSVRTDRVEVEAITEVDVSECADSAVDGFVAHGMHMHGQGTKSEAELAETEREQKTRSRTLL